MKRLTRTVPSFAVGANKAYTCPLCSKSRATAMPSNPISPFAYVGTVPRMLTPPDFASQRFIVPQNSAKMTSPPGRTSIWIASRAAGTRISFSKRAGSSGSAAFNADSVSNAAKAIMVLIFMAVVSWKGC